MYDLVIRGASIVDGTGAPAFSGDVAIEGGRIVAVGAVDGAARRTLAADGLLLTPGFVDIHTHYDGQATWDPHLTPSCWHGVTTAVLGNCGVGFAPARPDGHDELIELMEGVEDIPGSALSEGMRWGWETFAEYMDALAAMPRAIDVGTQIPHAALRAYVMGERANDDATGDDITAMARLVRDGLEAGALGFASGRTAGHRDIHGRPVPGTYAAQDELVALLDAMDAAGPGVFQLVPAGVGGEITGDGPGAMERELEWIVREGVRTQRTMTFLIMERGEADHWRPWFAAVHAANAAGAKLRPQVANRCFGVLFGHQSRLNPFRYHPSYAAIADLPFAERMHHLRDPQTRARILAEQPGRADKPSLELFAQHAMDRLFPLGADLDYEPAPDRSIAAIAAATGRDPWEVLYDVLLEHDGKEFVLLPLLNYAAGSYDGLLDMMRDPFTVQGFGDGGAHVGIVCDASMTTYMLTHWARDRTRGALLGLERGVRRLTRDPAELYGLTDRGVIAPGMTADLNLIDFGRLALVRPEQVCDLPAGAGRLVQHSEGYVATFVSGEEIVIDGELTEARPGGVVRGGATRR